MKIDVDFIVRILLETDSVNNFKTGDIAFQPLKTFLKKQAKEFQKAMVAQTYVCIKLDQGVDNGKVIAFITLTCSEIDIRNGYTLDDCDHAARYDSLPAIKIARLAVDNRFRKDGLGSLLVSLTTAIATDEIYPTIGCRFVVTDAKQQAIDFYIAQGFVLLDTEDNLKASEPIMFLDLLKL